MPAPNKINNYADVLPEGPFRDRYLRLCKSTPTESTSLYDEISFLRLVAEEAALTYAAADQIENKVEKMQVKTAAYNLITKSFARIESLSLTSAKIDQYNRTSAAVHLASVVIDEAITLADHIFKMHVPPEAMTRFARKLRQSFEINDGQGEVGTRHANEADLMLEVMDSVTQATELLPDEESVVIRPVGVDNINSLETAPKVVRNEQRP